MIEKIVFRLYKEVVDNFAQEDFALISAICFLSAQVPLDIKKLQKA